MRSFDAVCAAAESDTLGASKLFTSFSRELALLEFQLARAATVCGANLREQENYAQAQARLLQSITEALGDIEALKLELEGARVERKQKEEYEARLHFAANRHTSSALSPAGLAQAVYAAPWQSSHARLHCRREERDSWTRAGESSNRRPCRGERRRSRLTGAAADPARMRSYENSSSRSCSRPSTTWQGALMRTGRVLQRREGPLPCFNRWHLKLRIVLLELNVGPTALYWAAVDPCPFYGGRDCGTASKLAPQNISYQQSASIQIRRTIRRHLRQWQTYPPLAAEAPRQQPRPKAQRQREVAAHPTRQAAQKPR